MIVLPFADREKLKQKVYGWLIVPPKNVFPLDTLFSKILQKLNLHSAYAHLNLWNENKFHPNSYPLLIAFATFYRERSVHVRAADLQRTQQSIKIKFNSSRDRIGWRKKLCEQ